MSCLKTKDRARWEVRQAIFWTSDHFITFILKRPCLWNCSFFPSVYQWDTKQLRNKTIWGKTQMLVKHVCILTVCSFFLYTIKIDNKSLEGVFCEMVWAIYISLVDNNLNTCRLEKLNLILTGLFEAVWCKALWCSRGPFQEKLDNISDKTIM